MDDPGRRSVVRSYLLRIADQSNEAVVFEKRCYYTSLKRKFSRGDYVFFLMRREADSIIGYGVVDGVKELADITDPEERDFCINNRWYTKVELSEVYKFERHLPLRLVFPGLHKLGRALHGLELNEIEVRRIFDLEKICMEDEELWRKYVELGRRAKIL